MIIPRLSCPYYEQDTSEPAKKKKKRKNTDHAPETAETNGAEVATSGSLMFLKPDWILIGEI